MIHAAGKYSYDRSSSAKIDAHKNLARFYGMISQVEPIYNVGLPNVVTWFITPGILELFAHHKP